MKMDKNFLIQRRTGQNSESDKIKRGFFNQN